MTRRQGPWVGAALIAAATCSATLAGAGPLSELARAVDGASPEALVAFREQVEGWHEFFLMTGTAAVTLVGLLFVAISIHLDVLLHERRAHLLDLARQTLLTFLVVLLLSLMFLVPFNTPFVLALTVFVPSAIGFGFAVAGLVAESRVRDTGLRRRSLLRRRLAQILAFALLMVAAWQIGEQTRQAFLALIAPMCMLLANATNSAWDLLVQLGRLKAREEEAARR